MRERRSKVSRVVSPLLPWLAALAFAGCPGPMTPEPLPPPPPGPQLPAWRTSFAAAPLAVETAPRPAFGGLKVRRVGARVVTLEVRREPDGRDRQRLRASFDDAAAWTLDGGDDEQLLDFTVHPSGEVTVGLEVRSRPRDAYELVRLDVAGRVVARQRLARPQLIPAGDFGAGPRPGFAMKGPPAGAVVSGRLPWLRVEADGEDVVLGLLSLVEGDDGQLWSSRLVSAVVWLERTGGGWRERRSRLVDGPHSLIAVAWQYDEFLWLDAATRLLLSVEPDGRVVVGRTVSATRCTSLVDVFHEVSEAQCRVLRQGAPHRYQPFAFTVFAPGGQREGTGFFAPRDLEELVVFDMATRWPLVALVGTVVALGPDGAPAYYFDEGSPTPLSPYDGLLVIVEGLGPEPAVRERHLVELGRAEALHAVTWAPEALVAVGTADWDAGGVA